MKTVRILGIGSPAGDDQAGWLVVDELRARGLADGAGVSIDKLDRPGAGLVALLDKVEYAILVDAMRRGDTPGTIHVFSPFDGGVPEADLSSHGFGVLAALALAQALGSLPSRVEIIGIEVASTEPGAAVAPAVRAAARDVAHRISAALGDG